MKKITELEIGGISFGLTSGIITTLGLIVGLNSATGGSRLAIIAAIFTIAVADSLSDALGMQLSEESRLDEKNKPTWIITLSTFLGKFVFSLIFVLPILLLDMRNAVIASLLMGLALIAAEAWFIAIREKKSVPKQIISHTSLTLLIIALSYIVGNVADRIASR